MLTSDKLLELLNGLKKLVGKPIKIQIQALNRYEKILNVLQNEVKGPFKALVKRAYNGVQSLSDGLESGDASEKDLSELILDTRNDWQNCKKAEYIDQTKSSEVQSPEAFNSDSSISERIRTSLAKYKNFESLLPRTIQGKSFKALKMPISVVTKNMLQQEKLVRAGLSTGSIEGYPVLDNQVVVGMSDSFMEKHDNKIADAVQEILDALEEKTGQRYNHMGNGRLNGVILWVWVANDRTVRQLTQASVGGSLIVKGWDFPFQLTKMSLTHMSN